MLFFVYSPQSDPQHGLAIGDSPRGRESARGHEAILNKQKEFDDLYSRSAVDCCDCSSPGNDSPHPLRGEHDLIFRKRKRFLNLQSIKRINSLTGKKTNRSTRD